MLFVRDDILAEIRLKTPETWDDVYNCLTILQQNNMEFALPDSGTVNGFAMLLFQNQLNIYKDNGKKADINTEAGIEAFTKWTQFYKEYSLLMSYSFVNRFRSGDMPIPKNRRSNSLLIRRIHKHSAEKYPLFPLQGMTAIIALRGTTGVVHYGFQPRMQH